MNKSKFFWLKIILISLAVVGIFLLYHNQFSTYLPKNQNLPQTISQSSTKSNIEGDSSKIDLIADSMRLDETITNIIYSTTLKPRLEIELFTNEFQKSQIELSLDESRNVLYKSFYGKTFEDQQNQLRKIIFEPSFALKPALHKLTLTYLDNTGFSVKKTFLLLLAYKENFDLNPAISKTWIIPQGNPAEWFTTQDGKLLIIPTTGYKNASLVYLYPFASDFSTDFELTPLGNNVSFVIYSINSTKNEFVLGVNGNKTLLFHQKSNSTDSSSLTNGKEFLFVSGERYQVRLSRLDFHYELAIRILTDNENVDPTRHFEEKDIVLSFLDQDRINSENIASDQVGFALWDVSNGVKIDDVFLIPKK